MLTFLLAALAMASAADEADAAAPQAVVSRDGSRWTVDYALPVDAAGWAFPVAAPTLATRQAWREGAWKVLTPGVRIERFGAYDVLVAEAAHTVPRRVRVAFTPTNATLDREYDPALVFTGGSTALYSDQFDVAPVQDPNAIASREAGLSVGDLGGTAASVLFHDAAGPVFVSGRRLLDPVLRGGATYVVFGAASVQDVGGVAMLADPALPTWLKTDVAGFVPTVASTYAARLGARDDARLPLLLVGWRGATPGKVINDGGVRAGEILLNFEGEGLLDRNDKAGRRTRWFVAHELAHFWLGSEGIAYRAPGDAWITEGGAEMMAFTLLAASDRAYALNEIQRAVDDCQHLAAKPIATAGERHESRALYACGTVFALAATGVVRKDGGKDVYDFLRPLLAAHRADRRIGAAQWLSHVGSLPGGKAAAELIGILVDHGSDHAAETMEALLTASGVPHVRARDAIVLSPTAI